MPVPALGAPPRPPIPAPPSTTRMPVSPALFESVPPATILLPDEPVLPDAAVPALPIGLPDAPAESFWSGKLGNCASLHAVTAAIAPVIQTTKCGFGLGPMLVNLAISLSADWLEATRGPYHAFAQPPSAAELDAPKPRFRSIRVVSMAVSRSMEYRMLRCRPCSRVLSVRETYLPNAIE